MGRAAAGRVEQGGGISAMHRADWIVSMVPWCSRKNGTASFDLDKVEFKRRQDANLASRGNQSAELR